MTATSDQIVDALRAALRDNDRLKQQNQRREQAAREPIAIVGMGCRLPGGVDTLEALWRLVAEGGDAISGFPADRGWDLDALVDPDPDRRGTTYVNQGGFLHEASEFDAGFFGISPREALAMDPQQRLLLEVAWETLERARISPLSLGGTATGVFTAATGQDYGPLVHQSGVDTEGYLATGSAASVASGRLAYVLGLEGPAVTVDTACSSSLVALHLAVQALRTGECTLALAGGATLMAGPSTFLEFSRQRGLAQDGRCKAFSDAADGTSWAEGAVMVLVERLSDARRNGHRVLAVVRGTAVNQDGASNGLTAPNGPSQQRVIRAALANAGLSAADVDVVEAHGTGTTLGDPIEAQALLATYGQDRPADRPLWLGSVKSNLGHAQAAAGGAGLIKMVLAMRHGIMPKTLHVDTPSSHVDWSAGAVELLVEARDWPEADHPRRAGISAFGMSGTNAHVVIEQAPETAETGERPSAPATVVPWLVSGRSGAGLRGQAERLSVSAVGGVGGVDAVDVGWSLLTTRAALEHRAVVFGEYAAGLSALAGGGLSAGVVSGVVGPVGRTVLVFPGQGAQWVGMGGVLLDQSSVFAGVVAECERVMGSGLVDWSVTDVLRGVGGASSLDRVDVVQPVSFVVMVGLAAVWRSLGVVPSAVVGHSQGEIAAACVAGVLSLEDALRVVCLRSRAIAGLGGGGGMVSVSASAGRVRELIEPWSARVSVAAVNSPSQVVVSGDSDVIDAVVSVCVQAGVRARRIAVDYASHSAQMEKLGDRLAADLAGIVPHEARVPLFSTLTGEFVDPATMGAEYWFANLRRQVRFADAVGALAAQGFGTFVECSSHPVLVNAVEENLEALAGGEPGIVVGSLRRDDGGLHRFLANAAELWVRGVEVDWAPVFAGADPETVDLPTYAFQRQRYWPEPSAAGPAAASAASTESPADTGFWAAVEREDSAELAATLHTEPGVLDPLLPALARWRKERREHSVTDAWRYRVTWRPQNAGPAGKSGLCGTWLVVRPAGEPAGEPAAAVTDALTASGADVHVLTLSEADQDRTRIAELLAEQGTDVTGAAGVLSLLALDERPHPEQPAVSLGLARTVGLVQALGDAGSAAPLWILSRGAVSIGRSDPLRSPLQAAVWGLGRVVGLEHPDRWGGLIDLPARLDAHSADRLVTVLADGGEDQVALRASGSFLRRLVRMAPGEQAGRPWQPRGTALITGGTGAIGSALARWFAANGVEHLVLSGRRGADAPGAPELRAELVAQGVGVTIVACDVADRDAVARLLDSVPEAHPLTAVVHAAGVGQFRPLDGCGLAELGDTMAAKLLGAVHLDELLGDRPLDAFIMFSSNAGVWGSGGQAAYAAANAFLDALAQDRRFRGRTATSVAWGAWAEAGMAAGAAMSHHLQARGIRAMAPALAITALRRSVEREEATAVVADVDWARFAPSFAAARPRPLLDDLPEARLALDPGRADGASAAGDQGSAAEELRRRLSGRSAAEQLRELQNLVCTQAAAVLGYAAGEAVESGRAFRDLGFDSLTAVELRNRLGAATGLRLPVTLVFDQPRPRQLAEHLRVQLGGARPESGDTESGIARSSPAGAAADEPIAIIGMSCRLPGGVHGPDDLWRLLIDGTDALSAFPTDRGWASADAGGVRLGGFVSEAAEFDPAFFEMSPREALATDPQQRILLEAAWEAFEHSGIAPTAVRGSRTGVFIGCNNQGYATGPAEVPPELQGHLLVGNATSVVSGRVSYTLGLEGPAVTLDTACSSSLVALHWACQSLRTGESTLALAGGVTVLVTADAFTEFSRQGGLAADGRCKAFSDEADGTGWGEGVGILVLERLSDARRNGHRVLAVVAGSATNQDGASNGLSAPSGPAQQRVILAALADAGLEAADVDAVEAHGTGTSLGDPIEAQALLATYGQERPADRPLWLGSVKSNLGHTQSAAGAAGLIKMVLALHHGVLPKTLHAEVPTSRVDWSAGAVELLTEARDWPRTDRPRRAGVSSFGISGTNAHVIIEQAPAVEAPAAAGTGTAPVAPPVIPWVVSAKQSSGVSAQAQRLLTGSVQDADPVDVALSLATSRAGLDHRAVALGGDGAQLKSGLAALASGELTAGVVRGVADSGLTGFVFSGQGGQRVGMGRELAEQFPIFDAALTQVCAYFDGLLDRRLRDVMSEDAEDLLSGTGFAQPALFAIEVALFRLLESWGVRPDYLIGHSVGELAAAHVAGVLSLEEACTLVAARAGLMRALPGGGAMWAVRATAAEVRPLLSAGVSLASVNAPGQVVLSGGRAALEAVAAQLPDRRGRWLTVSHAFHSDLMDPMLAEFGRAAERISYQDPQIPIVSTLTGEPVTRFTARYWVDQVRGTVRFADAVARVREFGATRFVELGPDAGLIGAIDETCGEEGPVLAVPVLRRDKPEPATAITALARLWTRGSPVDWPAFYGAAGAKIVDLPTYAFQHERYWLGGRAVAGRQQPADQWTYRVDWTAIADRAGAAVPEPAAGPWLLLSTRADLQTGRVAAAIAKGLTARGAQPVPIALDPAAGRIEIADLLREHADAAGALLLLTESAGPDLSATALAAEVVHALGDAGVAAPLWCVTAGAVSTGGSNGVGHDGDEPPRPALAAVWGLGRVAALEHPDRWAGLVDLPAEHEPALISTLMGVLAGDLAGEDQIAIRRFGTFARRLVRHSAPADGGARPWALGGTVLVTGGTGALGAQVARRLAGRGVGHLVLISRRGLDAPGARALLDELTAAGVRTTIEACDVADRAALGALITALDSTDVSVDAVVHTAGVLDDGLLHTMTRAQLENVWSAKVTATANLDELLGERALSAFVLFSSLTGTLGAEGQAGYAAANAYLDALAQNRRSAGRAALSVAWGPWNGSGMAATTDLADRMRRGGLNPMDPGAALTALEHVLNGEQPCPVISDVDWARLARARGTARRIALIADLAAPAETVEQGRPAGAGSALRREILALRPDARHDAVLDAVRAQAASVLGHQSAAPVAADTAFSALGFDSMLAVELRGRLKELTGLALPATMVYDHPTPAALAGYLLAELLGGARPEDEPATPAPAGGGSAADEPIAIVSMSCRFAGGVDTPEALWRLLAAGTDALVPFPEDRGWDTAALYDPDPGHEGTCYARAGGFLEGAGQFDPDLFGINPREALAMDPQQRLLLECAWEAFERAGIDPKSVRGSRIGVFAGTNGQDYPAVLHGSAENVAGYIATGSAASVFSGRVAYGFGLEGPAITVDTACSASLVALHLACQALRAGECTAALVGGATVMSTPSVFVEFSRQRALAADGRCKAFSDDADGTGWGEGVGLVLVERLADARRHGHPVLAVVRGSAVNQDGASNGLTAPNGGAQQRVIRQALANAGLAATEVDAVEAHGTGTALGDPIEAQALLATYGRDRSADRPLWLGSIKSNLGHTQAAAGLAGVIKMVLALGHGTLPQTLHVSSPTSHVDWGDGSVRLLTESQTWPQADRPRRAGVSAFGVSGTNAHVILEQPPAPEPESADDPAAVAPQAVRPPAAAPRPEKVVPWVLSGRTGQALAGQAARLLTIAGTEPAAPIVDVAWSLATSRAALENRAAVIGSTAGEMAAALSVLAEGGEARNLITGIAGAPGKTVFVFPGQGGQWDGMAVELLETSPVFAAKLAECEQALSEFVDWRLTEVLRGAPGAPALDRVDVVQPALFAVMIGIAELWRSCGVRPHAVIGHSQGEIAAACFAGALSVRDAARVVTLRSRALIELAGSGGMVSLALAHGPAAELVDRYEGRVSIAAVNGPTSTVVSGDVDALEELLAGCERQQIRARRIPVDYASHCAQVDRIRGRLLEDLRPISPRAPQVPLLSTVTGAWIGPDEMDAEYWFRNIRQPVGLEPAVRALAEAGHRTFLEVSPHPVLTVPVQETLDALAAASGRVFVGGSLRREEGGLRRFTTSLAEAYVSGVELDWAAVFAGTRPNRADLPTYAFQRRLFWPRPAQPAETAVAADPVDGSFWEAVEQDDADGLAASLGLDRSALARVLPALSTWRRRRRETAAVDSWRYRIEWRPLSGRDPGEPAGTWLLPTPTIAASDWLDAVHRALDVPGADVIPIPVDAAEISRGELTALLKQHAAEHGAIRGVLSVLAADERPHPLHGVIPSGVAATMLLAQAMVDADIQAPLWLATSGAVKATPADRLAGLAQGQIWGLGRVIGLEHPDRWGGLVDLPAVLDEDAARRLRRVLGNAESEDQVAVREHGVFGRRLVHAPLGAAAPRRPWQPRGTALITGGLGGIGVEVARWLAESGVEHLVLVGRRGAAAPGAEQVRTDLTALGARVTIAACDVADRAALAELVAGLQGGDERIRTVVHAAGVVQATALPEMSLGEFAEVLSAKAAGAANLAEIFREQPLDAFVLFSSNAGVWGSGGQGAYAAANAYLDVLAQSRRAGGLAATSVAWGAWSGAGMATDPTAEEYLRRRGVLPMAPRQALLALRQALEQEETVLSVADVDWARFAPGFAAARPRPLLAELPEAQQALRAGPDLGRPGDQAGSGAGPAERLRALPQAERDAALFTLVCATVAAVLGHDGARAIDPGRAFKDLGFDSLTSVELRNRLSAGTGLTLPATLVFDFPTPLDLTGLLRGRFTGDSQQPQPSRQSAAQDTLLADLDRLAAGISDLSPEQDLDTVEARLRDLMSRLGDRRAAAGAGVSGGVAVVRQLETATDDELFDFIHREFGKGD